MPLFANNSVKYFQMADIAFESIFEDIKSSKRNLCLLIFYCWRGSFMG